MGTMTLREHMGNAPGTRQVPVEQRWGAEQSTVGTRHFVPPEQVPQGNVLSPLDLVQGKHPGVRTCRKHVDPKEVIFYKGDPASQLFVILSGAVKVSAPSEDGKEITFGILGSGELFGEIGMLDEAEHTATVSALEPTELAVLDRHDFLHLLEAYPDLTLRLVMILCKRLRQASEVVEDLSFLTLPVRLAKKLLALARTYGRPTPQGVRIGLHLCQQELANLVSTTRESINKQLAVWQGQGLVTMEHGLLTIHRFQDLVSMANPQCSRGETTRAVG